MADPGLVKRMVEDGWGREAAIEQVDTLTTTILAQLNAGKSVSLDGVCRLTAVTKTVKVHTPLHLNHLRSRRMVKLAKATILEDGEPYPDPRYVEKKRSTYGRGV